MKHAPTYMREHSPRPDADDAGRSDVGGDAAAPTATPWLDRSSILILLTTLVAAVWLVVRRAVPDGVPFEAATLLVAVTPPVLAARFCLSTRVLADVPSTQRRGWMLLGGASVSAAVLAGVTLAGPVAGLPPATVAAVSAIAETLLALFITVAMPYWIQRLSPAAALATTVDTASVFLLGYLLAVTTPFAATTFGGLPQAASMGAVAGIAFPLVLAAAMIAAVAVLSQIGRNDVPGQSVLATFGAAAVVTSGFVLAYLSGDAGGSVATGFARMSHALGAPTLGDAGWTLGFLAIAGAAAGARGAPAEDTGTRRPLLERSAVWESVWALVPLALLAIAIVSWETRPQGQPAPRGAFLALTLLLVGRVAVSAVQNVRQSQTLHVDPLTGALNHRSFQERITTLTDRAIESRVPLSLAMIDIDDFELLNDTAGHGEGDRFLREIANTIRDHLDASHVMFRSGGDEFAVAMPGATGEDAERLARELARACERVNAPGSIAPSLTVGIATLPTHTFDAHELVRLAEGTLYWGKLSGKHNVTVYDPRVVKALSADERVQVVEKRAQLRAVLALARALDARDAYTARHSQNVARNAEAIAVAMGWSADQSEMLRIAGLLHDVGKIGVPDTTLRKSDGLTSEEWDEMRRHPILSARMIDGVAPEEAIPWVLAHHERMDGRGYPEGLAGDMIPMGARILAVADALDAMTSSRSYRPAMPVDWALQEISSCVGEQFDGEVVDALMRAIASGAVPIEERSGDVVTIDGIPVTRPNTGLTLDPEFSPDVSRRPDDVPDDARRHGEADGDEAAAA